MESERLQTRVFTRSLSVILAITMLAASPVASAAIVGSSGTVALIYTYPDYGGGDFVFKLSQTPSPVGCESGFWLSPSQPGFKTSVAFVMKAHAAGETIVVGGNTALGWPGSSGAYCKVDYLSTAQ